jgi:hypothetical protein
VFFDYSKSGGGLIGYKKAVGSRPTTADGTIEEDGHIARDWPPWWGTGETRGLSDRVVTALLYNAWMSWVWISRCSTPPLA